MSHPCTGCEDDWKICGECNSKFLRKGENMARDYTEEMCKEEEKTEQSHWLTVVKLFDYYNDECSLTVDNEKGEDVLSIDTESHGCVGLDKKLAKEMGELLLHWSQTGELRVPERSK